MNKYRKGDKVWIKTDMVLNEIYLDTGTYYKIHFGEKDIRGKQVIITDTDMDSWSCKKYRNFHWKMIDEEKTNLPAEPVYEIY